MKPIKTPEAGRRWKALVPKAFGVPEAACGCGAQHYPPEAQGGGSHIPGCPAGPAPDAVQYRVRNFETKEFTFHQSACSALRGTLPKSERVIEANTPGYAGPCRAVDAAHADLRRKVATLREWPLCPVSKEPLRIEAKVSEEKKYGRYIGTRSENPPNLASLFCVSALRGGR